MPIVTAEIKSYRSTTVGDTGSNGGRLSSTELISGALGGLFPNVTPTERTAGVTKYRKFFMKVANASSIPLVSPKFWQDKNTAGADRMLWWPATQRNTQTEITGTERKYGTGALQATVLAGVTTFVCTVEDGTQIVFVNGDVIRITDKANLAGAGNEEYVTISAVPSIVGNNVTIVFTPALANGYTAAAGRISSVYSPATIQPSFDNFVVTSAAGTYNSVTNPIVVDAIGGIEQTWTLTWTGATTFNIVGDTVGAMGTGTFAGGAAPTNADFARPYFTMASAGMGGTYVSGNTIVFQTHPAALPVWVRQIVPAGAAVAASNVSSFILLGETA